MTPKDLKKDGTKKAAPKVGKVNAGGDSQRGPPSHRGQGVKTSARKPPQAAKQGGAADPDAGKNGASSADPALIAEAEEAKAAELRVEAAKAQALKLKQRTEIPEAFLQLPETIKDVVEAAFFYTYAMETTKIVDMHVELAALAVGNPSELQAILSNHTAGEKRTEAIHAGFMKLPSSMRDLKREVVSLVESGKLPVLKIESLDPIELSASKPQFHEALTATAITKGLALPPESYEPWRWTQWWEPIIELGADAGAEFIKGLHKASVSRGGASLNLRARVAGHRPTALKTVGYLLQAAAAVDLRDNRIVDAEIFVLAAQLESTQKATKVNVAGNRLTAGGAKAVGLAVSKSEARISELDISRNRLGESTREESEEAFAELAGLSRKLAFLCLSGLSLSDDAGSGLMAAFAKLNMGQRSMLTRLDLHNNQLGPSFAAALPSLLGACPALTSLDLSKNSLGVVGGVAIANALTMTTALKTLDLSKTNLCNCTPTAAQATRAEWSGEAVAALAAALADAPVSELHIYCNGLCGLWTENICGDMVTRGTYTAVAIDNFISMFDKGRIAMKREGLKFEELNYVRSADAERLHKVMKENASKPQRKDTPGLGATQIIAPVDNVKDNKKDGEGGEKKAAKMNAPEHEKIDLESVIIPGKQDAMALRKKSMAPGAVAPAEIKVMKELNVGSRQGDDEDNGPIDPNDWRARRDAELKMEEAHDETKAKQEKRAAERKQGHGAEADAGPIPGAPAEPGPGARKRGAGKTERPSPGESAAPRAKKGAGGGDDKPPKASKQKSESAGSGLTPRTNKSGASGGGSGLTPRSSKNLAEGAPAAEEKPAAPAAKTGGYGQATGKGKKKKVQEVVVEEAPNPFAGAPLMIAMSNLIARTDIALNSPMVAVNPKVSAGALMRVSQTEELKDNARGKMQSEHRMYVALDGDQEALGWVTGISKDEVEHLKLAGAGFPLMYALKALNCREGKENDSKKLEDVPRRTFVRVMETETMPDGTEKALIARDAPVAEPLGWVVVRKEGQESRNIEPAPVLQITFDLKVHTATALSKALKAPKDPLKRKKKDTDALPFYPAGRRPITRPEDGPAASRHRLVDKPASTMLIFNCYQAQFEVTAWTGDVPFDKLSGESAFDLISKTSKKRLGRVGLAKELGQPFLERVEFPDDWLIADDHGVMHDGWQGTGILDLELTWGKAVAQVRVLPWLAYGCTVGARFLIRKMGAAEGQCATVQRILGDDRVVARVDGYAKSDGVKGETIVDLQPSTVVRTTSVGYPRDTKVLVLHNGKLVDAQVLAWLGGTDFQDGSRHMVNIKPIGSPTGCHAWYDLNMFNHVATQPDMNADTFEQTRVRYCGFLTATEDKVEDAITGNHLQIKDQLIFMEASNVSNGCNPPEYMALSDVPGLCELLVHDSPKRQNGTHNAQPVLCRAGPGTGKTWMVKQSLFLLAEKLGGDTPGEGIRLVPVIVFVQRIVRLLNELGDDPSELLSDPNGLMRWYISNQFAEKKEEKAMLLQAYEMSALVILVDGVDEAAGLRELVEAFVHYELVTSGNRLVVTSRPEGVDLEDYKTRFVVMNLKELSQEQQRNVIQMQLAGNAFFEHLVNIAECRKELDAAYHVLFKSEALRNEMEAIEFVLVDEAEDKSKEDAAKEEEAKEEEADEADKEDKGKKKKSAAKSEEEEQQEAAKNRRASLSYKAPEELVKPMVRRRLAMDNQQDMMAFMQQANIKETLLSNFLEMLNQKMTLPTKAYGSLLDQLDTEIRLLPSPCTRAALEAAIVTLEQAQPSKTFELDLRESVVQLGLQRKMPIAGGRRGAKAAPIPAHGLWYQITQHCDDKYLQVERYLPVLMYVLGSLAAATGIRDLALQVDEATGRPIPSTQKWQPEITYRDPVALWLHSTYPGATEPTERPPEAWVASALMKCDTGEQCLQLVRRLTSGIEVEVGAESALFTMLALKNAFTPEFHHPTHLRNASCHMMLTFRNISVAVQVQVEHKDLLQAFTSNTYIRHNNYFWHRILTLTEEAYDAKFETLLLFLVEAIGVPVLLSLLLLTYSNTTGGDVIDLDELPEGRLQLYKLGIMSGIKKRLVITLNQNQTGAGAAQEKQGTAEEEAAAAENRPKRERRKGALEQSLGTTAGPASGGPTTEVKQTKHATNEPVLDLNSILRGKKVRVVTGEEDVAEAYSLVVRVLDKSKQAGFDLRSGIVAVVPKSHTMHAIVTALVEYVLAPLAINESSLFEIGKKMLRHVAVDNQENGRREFTSKHVACALGATPEELGLWSRLDLDYDHGVALTATLAKQSDKAPAQYQFKHLSFQEGLYAEHLLLLVTSLTPPNGNGWPGWASDKTASEFLNNRYMNNTCRIAAGHLGSLLAKQRPEWDFRQHPLSPNGRAALWYVTDDNDQVQSINVANNDVGTDDVPGISKTISTCSNLQKLELSDNDLVKLTVMPSEWSQLCDAFSSNSTLTDLNLNNNRLGPTGVRIAARALRGTVGLKRLGFSFNEPGVEHALADLLRQHPALTSVELVEALDRHLPSRSKDDIGRALLENKAKTLGFLHCDTFILSEDTTSLSWPKEASTSDAVLLAGVLVTNTVLTTFNIGSGASLANTARSALGEALLNNPGSRVAFCNDFGLAPKVDTCEFDLSRTELKDVEPFRLLAGCLRGNRTLTHVTLRQLRMEQIDTLALALRGNSTLARLDIIHTTRLGGESIVRLPVPELNGSRVQETDPKRVDMSKTCIEGNIGRVACAMIGTLTAANTTLECLNLSNTGLGLAIGSEGEGGHIVLRPMCESKTGVINELVLNNIQLNDKAGAKLFSALAVGLGKGDAGYEKITSLSVANNDLGKGSAAALKQLLWGERAPCQLKSLDLSDNGGLDGYDAALAIKRNESLTSVDLQNIPSANTEEIYSFLGQFLLQEECMCRLGLLSCDAFQVVSDQKELVLLPPAEKEQEAKAEEPSSPGSPGARRSDSNRPGVMSLLAGVLKFNQTLKTVKLANTGLDDASGAFFATALLENKTLESIDISGNPLLGATGITEIARAARDHPALVAVKVDGKELPISQLRGAKGADGSIDFADASFGPLSGHAIGTIVTQNRTLLNLNLKSNKLGADGVAAVVRGLSDTPLKALDVTRNALGAMQQGALADVKGLAESICRNLGALVDLRMDENDLDCPASALAPLCKLRYLRILSWEKNRLAELPPLIGTMLSLRKLLLHSNQLMELPTSLCLLTALETLDVHKNLIPSLPSAIGNMKALQKLDISENKLQELPISICELNDELQLSVGRNPLEKPSVEQARQGIGAIRRFFGFSRGRAGEEGLDADKEPKTKALDGEVHIEHTRPKPSEGSSSRHDWAGPGATIVLFNCYGCRVREVEGGSELATIPNEETVEMTCEFNLQTVGRIKEASSHGQPFAQRVEFFNEWLPWREQEIEGGAPASAYLLITLKWKVLGAGKNSAKLLVTPWLAYGCSVGARIKTDSGYATVMSIKEDDTCEVMKDNVKEGTRPEAIDPRPDTVGRTTSPTYKANQKLLLLHDGVPVDAIVDEWLGIRKGSRHRVRLVNANKAGAPAGPGGGKGADGKVGHDGKGGKGNDAKADGKFLLEVDLNESNHAKLLFPNVGKYEDARTQYCDKILIGKHATVRDEATGSQLKVMEQRMYVKPFTVTAHVLAKDEGEDGEDGRSPSLSGDKQSPPMARPHDAKAEAAAKADAVKKSADEKAKVEAEEAAKAAEAVNSLLDAMILPVTGRAAKATPLLIRARSRAEHELLTNHCMYWLAHALRDPHPKLGPIRLAPICLSAMRLMELQADEATAKQGARAIIVKAFEEAHPGMADMLRQTMDMRAIVAIVEVREQGELKGLSEMILEELRTHRFAVTCSGINADGAFDLPQSLTDVCQLTKLSSVGLYMNDVRVADRLLSNLFKRIRFSSDDASYYRLVAKLHVATSEVGAGAMRELTDLLASDDCSLASLDLSFTQVDGYSLVQALKRNKSLTSLNLTSVPTAAHAYKEIAAVLLEPDTTLKLGYMRCDAFDLHEGERVLSLREQPLPPSAMRLLCGLLRNNHVCTELDLAAADIENEGAAALATALDSNTVVQKLCLSYNPALDDESRKLLRDTAERRTTPPLHLEM